MSYFKVYVSGVVSEMIVIILILLSNLFSDSNLG